MFPGGIEVTPKTHDEQVEETRRLLERDDVTLFEGAIRSLTTRNAGKSDAETGNRALVDLCRLAAKAFSHLATKGSNSIKKVLPAVMLSSDVLKGRYSQPIYGAKGGVRSLNFKDQVWWREPLARYQVLKLQLEKRTTPTWFNS
jgi:hypothetical protein